MSESQLRGLTPFKFGVDWNGNRDGRPKKVFHPDKFTDELFLEDLDGVRTIKKKIFESAINGEPWAMKLVFEYFLTKPKNDDSGEPDAAVHGAILEELDEYTTESKIAVREILIVGRKEPK